MNDIERDDSELLVNWLKDNPILYNKGLKEYTNKEKTAMWTEKPQQLDVIGIYTLCTFCFKSIACCIFILLLFRHIVCLIIVYTKNCLNNRHMFISCLTIILLLYLQMPSCTSGTRH